ncbi:sugar transferase [Streptococcus sp. SN3]|uniref:sugar transferase n=1 Tax=Streptococcus sp. SN3 TaxID=3018246 RepID=UPI00263E912D|nr:sugar transferase [Streptococcus sp. SN3]MDN5012711.1 sugar transferase [Streptococcus sp. SN3]
MFENRKEFQKIEIVLTQLLSVVTISTIMNLVLNSKLTSKDIIILVLLHIVAFYISNYGYHFFKRGYLIEFTETIKYSALYTVMITFFSFMSKGSFLLTRKDLILFILLNAVCIYCINLLIKQYYLRVHPKLKSSKKVLVITVSSRLDRILQQLTQTCSFNDCIAAVSVFDNSYYQHPNFDVVPRERLIEFATRSVVDEVFISLPSDYYSIEDLVIQFENMGITVNVNINALDFQIGEKRLQEIAGFSVVTFSTNFYNYSHIVAKRILDIIGSFFGLLLCGIAAIFLVPMIRKDGGPAIFVQERVGKNGRIFKFYKFRSMYIDAEERKKELMAHNTMSGGMFKMDDDPRITPIGKFIRKTSLDELPQFYNVLKGDMSLVGTRPPTKDEYEHYTPEQKRRLSFKPGITGLWQISGRSSITNFDEVVKLDVAYIDGWTIWSDIKILLKTIKVVLMKDGAK